MNIRLVPTSGGLSLETVWKQAECARAHAHRMAVSEHDKILVVPLVDGEPHLRCDIKMTFEVLEMVIYSPQAMTVTREPGGQPLRYYLVTTLGGYYFTERADGMPPE